MSSAGSFQGLQFRIMETLENQPNQAPLTALEIADILHRGEYRNEMKDNVVFKVSRAVHGMKEQGKIIVSDARDKDGRLCYQLPTRTKFPPKSDGPPANPVLTPEVAAQVKTVEPQPEPKSGRQPYVPGIQDKIIEFIGKSPHPVTAGDITDALGHLYAGHTTDRKRLTTTFAGHLYHLARVARRIFRRKITGYGSGIQFEYYTRKTGTAPHPLTPKSTVGPAPAPKAVKGAPSRPPSDHIREVAAPLPSKAWAEPSPPPQGGLFRPQRTDVNELEVKFRVPAEWNNRLVAAAKQSGLSITEFMRQAVDFAIDHLDA